MSNPIEGKDIAKKGALNEFRKGAELTTVQFDELEKSLKAVAKQTKELIKLAKNMPDGIEKVLALNKARKQSTDVQTSLSKIESQRVKLLDMLNEANSDAIQDNEEIKVQLQEQKKVNKELAKEKLKLIGTYEKESKRLVKLRKDFKNLRLEEGKDTKATEKLRKEIVKLDRELKDVDESAGQFQRSVGEYPDTLGDATDSITEFATGAILASASLGTLEKGLESNETTAGFLEAATEGVSAAFSGLVSNIGTTFKLLGEGEIVAAFLNNTLFSMAKATGEAAVKGFEAGESAREFRKELLPLELQLVKVTGELDRQNQIAGDTTKSFNAQAAATKAAQKLQIERAVILLDIADRELEVIDQRIEARGKDANVLELQEQRNSALIKQKEASIELDLASIENEKILSEIRRDRFEQELDFAIDAFDAVKTVTERQIALEGQTIIQRVDNLNKLKRLSESSFQSQIELVNKQVGENIRLNELVREEDEKTIRARLKGFEIDEITTTRILEVIRERKLLLQDIVDAENDVTKAIQEQAAAQQELGQEIDQTLIAGEIAAAQRAENLEEEFELRKRSLTDQAFFETNLVAESAEEQELIAAQLNNDLAALEAERVEAVEDANEKIAESDRALQDQREEIALLRVQSAQNVAEALSAFADEDGDAAKNLQRIKKILAVNEILLNLRAEVSAIRRRNADKEDSDALNRAQVGEARTSALAGVAQILAFEKGGLVEGGEQLVRINEKGEEFVIDASTTKSMGLDKKGSSMQDFQSLMMQPHAFKDLEIGKSMSSNDMSLKPLIKQGNDNTDKMIKAIEDNTPTFIQERDDLGSLVLSEIRKTSRKVTTYKRPLA